MYIDMDPKLTAALGAVVQELEVARKAFPAMRSNHEGYAILLEEVEELWADIKANKDPRAEAIQVAAMAIRFLIERTDAPKRGEFLDEGEDIEG